MSEAIPAGAGIPRLSAHPARPEGEFVMRSAEEKTFLELRRKAQDAELLSASTERLLLKMRFSGRLTVVVQNGRVLKSGYEEGPFRRKDDLAGGLES